MEEKDSLYPDEPPYPDVLSQEEIQQLLSVAEGDPDERRHFATTKEVTRRNVYSVFKNDVNLITSMSLDDMKIAIAILWNVLGIDKSDTPEQIQKYCQDYVSEYKATVRCCPKCKSEDIELISSEVEKCNSCGKKF